MTFAPSASNIGAVSVDDTARQRLLDVATQQVLIGHRTAAGWFVDAVASRALNATTDYTLGVTVRGASVSVTLNGQATIGFVYNAVAADGRSACSARARRARASTR